MAQIDFARTRETSCSLEDRRGFEDIFPFSKPGRNVWLFEKRDGIPYNIINHGALSGVVRAKVGFELIL